MKTTISKLVSDIPVRDEDVSRVLMRAEGETTRAAAEFTCPVTIQAAAGENKLPRFEMTAYTGGPIRPKLTPRLAHPVVVDLAGVDMRAQQVVALKDHDALKLVGHTEQITSDGRTLKASGVISGTGPAAQEVAGAGANGFAWQVSMSANLDKLDLIPRGKTIAVNGRSVSGPVYVARSSQLLEFSFLSMGAADNEANARIAAGAAEGTAMTFEEWLKANGFQPDQVSEKQRVKLQAAYDAEQAGDEGEGDEQDEGAGGVATKAKKGKKVAKRVTARAAADEDEDAGSDDDDVFVKLNARFEAMERSTTIRAMCSGHDDIAEKAIKGKWTDDHVKAAIEAAELKGRMPQSVQLRAGASKDAPDQGIVMEAALCMAGNIPDLDKTFDKNVLEEANRQFRGRMGLQQCLMEAATANGYSGRPFGAIDNDLRGVLEYAFGSVTMKASGFSTISVPGIFTNTANKFLLAGFMGIETVWRQIADIGSVKDFKAITSYRLTGGMEYEEVGADGEIKHGSIGEESYTNRARTYAKMFGITRQDIINDDLNALTAIPKMLGRGAGLKLNKVFWTEFLENAGNFFHADNSNLVTGTSLNIAGLTAAELKYLGQTDPDGNPLAVAPDTLLVPSAHLVTATSLMNATEIRDTTASTKYTTNNPHAGKFRVLSSVYLSNSTITGNSSTTWFLLSSMFPIIQVLFLNGRQNPVVETADADFNTLGVQMRGYHDFGVAKQDSRGGVKVTA